MTTEMLAPEKSLVDAARFRVDPRTSIRWVVAALLVGTLLSTLDMTIVSTAMPRIVRKLGGFQRYSWVFTAYMLTSTIFMPIFGKLSDLFGRKLLYIVGVSLFLAGSLLSGFAHNMTSLILFRGLQGIGGASLAPIAMAIMGDLFLPAERIKIQGLFAAVFGLGSITGPVVGGLITNYLSWSWVFWLNVPVGLIGIIIIVIAFKEVAHQHGEVKVDYPGAALLLAGLTSLLLALNMGGVSLAWNSSTIGCLFLASILCLALFLYVETRVEEPLVPFKLFQSKSSSGAYVVIFLIGSVLFGAVSYIPLYMQNVKGLSAANAGYILTPAMLGVIATSLLAAPLAKKFGQRSVIVSSIVVLGSGFYLLSRLQPTTSLWVPYIDGVILGLGLGAGQSLLYTLIQNTAPAAFRGIAVSLAEFCNVIGGSIGVTLMGLVVNHVLANRLTKVSTQLALSQSLDTAFLLAVGMVVITLLAAMLVGDGTTDVVKAYESGD